MTLGIALVLIFVLYLIDKHNRWRQAFKLTVGLAVLGIVGFGGFFGWQKYQAWREEKQAQTEAAAELAKASPCVSRLEQFYKQTPLPKDAVLVLPGETEAAAEQDTFLGACLYNPLATSLPSDAVMIYYPTRADEVREKARGVKPGASDGWTPVEAGK